MKNFSDAADRSCRAPDNAAPVKEMMMRAVISLSVLAFLLSGSHSPAQPLQWINYRIVETGTSVDMPISIFTEAAGKAGGYGQQFRRSDGRADLTVQAEPNSSRDSPAVYLEKRNPPPHIIYKRITDDFFVVSSTRGDRIWYDRCNFTNRFVHCVLIDYPADEKRQWDAIVTRISKTLRGG
jgi:hypothetical protein